jgi:ribosomal protein S18 acetylase RimI-like enzyme
VTLDEQTKEEARQVRALVATDKKAKLFLGGVPFTEGIVQALNNHNAFYQSGLPNRRRVCLGSIETDSSGIVIGYQETTILRSANMNSYDKKCLPLLTPLTYVQLKKIIVHPDWRGQGVAKHLLDKSIEHAKMFCLEWCTDVKAENECMCKFLKKQNAKIAFMWKTPRGKPMLRFSISY